MQKQLKNLAGKENSPHAGREKERGGERLDNQ